MRMTIDYGIDLGTTNSAIAVLNGVVPEIIKDNDDLDITSSAVHVSKHGQLRVGKRARQQLHSEAAEDDVYVEFKRRMGTDHIYKFRSAERCMSPEELSAEVLKSLCSNAQQRLGEQVSAAVITVPAAFEQKECAATKRAAELAGLRQCPLVQEPVAAALAYGFQSQAEREYWLVYDFGGGTFDAALVKADDGVINIVNHGGDNYLGGADIDWEIVEQIILPRMVKEYHFPDLHRKNPAWRMTIAKVKHAAEIAKIELSRSEKTYLTDCIVKDGNGKSVEIDFPLTRNEVIHVATPKIMESVVICKRVLSEKQLAPSMIDKVILVGGPTLAPYFRELLANELKVALDYSIDPLTVVARGAAVFAGTQKLQVVTDKPVVKGSYRLDLNYSPVGPDEDFRVRGKILSDGDDLNGFTISFLNSATAWDSGKLSIKSGAFKADLLGEAGVRNRFNIQLAGPNGLLYKTEPDHLVYTIGTPFGDQPVINSLGVEIQNNEFDSLLEKGMPLPAKRTKVYRTARSMHKGESGEMLTIPIVEGENPKADRNRLQGVLTVKGTDIRRDIPAGSEVEVTLLMDQDRCIRARAFITMLDEEFEVVITPEKRTPDAARLKGELKEERKRLDTLKETDVSNMELQAQETKLQELEELAETAKGDPDAANKAEAKILEVKAELDKIENDAKWPSQVAEVRKALDEVDKVIKQLASGDAESKRRAVELRTEAEQLIFDHREALLAKKLQQIYSLYYEVLASRDEFWVQMLEYCKDQRTRMKDQALAGRLFGQAEASIQRGDAQQLRQIVSQLMELLPPEVQGGFNAGGYATGATLQR